MKTTRSFWTALGTGAWIVVIVACAPSAAAPLTEQDLTTLLKVGLDPDVVVSKIKSSGVAFEPSDEIKARLKAAGASDAVLDAITSSSAKPADSAVTYEDILKLLDLQIPEDAVLKRLAASPTLFTLDAQQIQELKSKGASDRLIEAMQKGASPGDRKVEISDIALILDCSASMEEQTDDGRTKMQVARKVMTDLVNGIPDGLFVSFIVYGHDKAQGCKAVKVVRSLSALDDAGKKELASFIASVPDVGNTPIALSLETAAAELSKHDNYCGIVLVTDGKESCHGDPAAVAKKLAANPKLNFGVNVIGFGVKPEEAEALRAIARAGRGNYYDAESAEEFAKVVGNLRKEITASAKPAPKTVSNRRAVKIMPPAVEMPAMAEIVLVETDGPIKEARLYKKGGINKYGDEIRVPSGTAKYDIVWYPKDGEAILVMKGLSLPERKVVEVKIEEHVGFIKVNGSGTPQSIHAAAVGDPTVLSFSTQRAKKFGDVMVVPVGSYNVLVGADLIEEGLKVEAGQLYELE